MVKRRTFLKACAVGGIGVGFGGFYDTFFHLVPFNDRGRKALHHVYGNSDSPEWLRDPASGKLAPIRTGRSATPSISNATANAACGSRSTARPDGSSVSSAIPIILIL